MGLFDSATGPLAAIKNAAPEMAEGSPAMEKSEYSSEEIKKILSEAKDIDDAVAQVMAYLKSSESAEPKEIPMA